MLRKKVVQTLLLKLVHQYYKDYINVFSISLVNISDLLRYTKANLREKT